MGIKMEEFENGWEINIVSFLRKVLEPGSIWTSKESGKELIIQKRLKNCIIHDNGDILIKDLVKSYNPSSLNFEYCGIIEYGAKCNGCGQEFEYQKKSKEFRCWACKSGY